VSPQTTSTKLLFQQTDQALDAKHTCSGCQSAAPIHTHSFDQTDGDRAPVWLVWRGG